VVRTDDGGDIDEQLAWMALADVGSQATAPWLRLARDLGSARAVFEAPADLLEQAGLTPEGVARCRGYDGWARVRGYRERCARMGVRVCRAHDDAYPERLLEIADPPLVLYYRGLVPARLEPAVAVVGSRRASRYGLRWAARLGRELAASGVVVVSGLARGVDSAAHEGALEAGVSAAVLASGPDRVYPACNRRLSHRLAEVGSLMSEYPPGTPSQRWRFPVRNRIITGLARATVVVEAALRSGSKVSGELTINQGRELFALPGNIDSPSSRGTNELLRDGATPLLDVEDVLRFIHGARAGAAANAADAENPLPDMHFADPDAARVLAALELEGVHPDDLAIAVGLDGARIMELLTALELDGLAQRLPGGTFARRAEAGAR